MMNPIDKVISLSTGRDVAVPNKEIPLPFHGDLQQKDHEFQRKINEIHEAIKEHLQIDNCKLNFSIDSETRTVVVRVLDADTGKVIQEIPPEEILAMAKEIEKLKGILFNENV
jgi:flagellar protein FlaG